jgi:hypothetical protein
MNAAHYPQGPGSQAANPGSERAGNSRFDLYSQEFGSELGYFLDFGALPMFKKGDFCENFVTPFDSHASRILADLPKIFQGIYSKERGRKPTQRERAKHIRFRTMTMHT